MDEHRGLVEADKPTEWQVRTAHGHWPLLWGKDDVWDGASTKERRSKWSLV